jgi:hypothetical protein
MKPPRASNQVSLWQPFVWQLGNDEIYTIGDRMAASDAVYVVDCAIRRMMEKTK